MSFDKNLRLVLCWHMHQPEYRNLKTDEFVLPWTYLHAIKDYVDMVAHLENCPDVKAVVNFSPILLEQIEAYAQQLQLFLLNGHQIKDPLLAALSGSAIATDKNARLQIISSCKKANRERQIERYSYFAELVEMSDWLESHPQAIQYIDNQFFFDLLVWYHLAWLGETVKRNNSNIQKLIDKASGFTIEDRFHLIEIIYELINNVLGRYKVLAEKGQIELSVTPFAHPIMPLLLDLQSAREAMPDVQLPAIDYYPGGEERVRWHLQHGIEVFQRCFGFKPDGCWPSEGSLSEQTLQILSEFGFKWTASGGNVLRNSLKASGQEQQIIHHPFQLKTSDISCFFRDDGLSDLIGFEYSKWHADHAVNDLIHHLENISHYVKEDAVVSIIMDGENAWEYFPENGYYFLTALYEKLTAHPSIELTTFSDCINSNLKNVPLKKLVAGSWVYGTFSTWVGDKDKNRGWEMLADAKAVFDNVIAKGQLSQQRVDEAKKQLAICEGSDWFWWFGDYNPDDAVSSFEKQFRLNLRNLYDLLAVEWPEYLSLSFAHGSGAPDMGGAMRRGNMNQ